MCYFVGKIYLAALFVNERKSFSFRIFYNCRILEWKNGWRETISHNSSTFAG